MNKFQLDLVSRRDRNGDLYYFTTTRVPVSIDLSKTVLLVYPSADGSTATLVIKPHDQEHVNKRPSDEEPEAPMTRTNPRKEKDHG
jgi:hypothetical protein